MGFKISWIGFNGLGREECLRRLNMSATREVDEAQEQPFSLAELPNNWIILFANDFDYVSDKRLASLSTGATIIGCRIHEGVMYSDATWFNAERKTWSISHFAQNSAFDLSLFGEPPSEILAIKDRLLAKQKGAGEASDVDYLFDVPVEAAQFVTSYRHDLWEFDWGQPVFHVLRLQ